MMVRSAPHELHLILEVATSFADSQVHAQPPALEQAESAILSFRDEMRNLAAIEH